MTTKTVQALENAWKQLCADAGWTATMYCTPDLKARRAYEARVDQLAAERRETLTALIKAARGPDSDRYDAAYVDGIERALHNAIHSPRQP